MAYASIASLMRTIELLLTSNSPMQSLICDHKEEFLALQGKVSSLEVFLKNMEKNNDTKKMAYMESQIKDVMNAVEHTIQLRLTEAVMANDEMQKEKEHKRLFDSLKQVVAEIDHVQNESPNIQDYNTASHYQRDWLLEKLIQHGGSSGKSNVISIIGMGGIGKTTLAKEVYDDEFIRYHFDVRAWVTISQQYNVRYILESLLHSTMGGKFSRNQVSDLADMLRKSLIGKRYLIVMDDMWSSMAWDDVCRCFPCNNHGSRILLTTRSTEVAYSDGGTENLSLCMDLMDQDESWSFAKSMVFAKEALPYEFETIGKQIVEYCTGLPLVILVISGLLSRSKRTIEDWENIAEDVMSFVTKDPYERYLHVLGLSYNHLTSDLKACLLYFGIFPEDSEISVKSLVRFWMAEGFLKSEKDLEREAEKCLQELIDRHLVLVCKKSLDGTKIRSCKVHDLIHELCLRELTQSQDIFVIKDIVFDKSYEYDDLDEGDDDSGGDGDSDAKKGQSHAFSPECHHLSTLKMQPFKRWTDDGMCLALLTPEHDRLISRQTDDDDYTLLKRTRSIFSFRINSTFTLNSELIHFSLLRILDLGTTKLRSFPPHVLCLIWLRYLALSCIGWDFYIPPEICRLWNLQTLIVKWDGPGYVTFTEKIWELMQLRQLRLQFYLPNPPRESDDEESYLAFSNIHTISGLSPRSCTKEVISGIRNVKKLVIYGHVNDYKIFQESRLFDNLVHLHQLETLKFKLEFWSIWEKKISPVTIPSAKAFPVTLRKLKLDSTFVRWEYLNIMCELPNLEVLKLMRYACIGEEWYPIEGGFTRLKLLLIAHCDLKYLKATDDNFPVLERLLIRHCRRLTEIPIDFADIFSLQLIELTGCTTELEASAKRIATLQEEEYAIKSMDVRISSN